MAQAEIKKKTTKISPVKKPIAASKVAKTKIIKPIEVKPGLAKFINKNLKVSPRKLRLLANNIKKLKPADAVIQLRFTNSSSARLLVKCVEDAIASAVNNHHLLPQTLKFTDFRVDEGLKIKRMDKSHGSRFARGIIQKRHSRLIIVLSGTIAS